MLIFILMPQLTPILVCSSTYTHTHFSNITYIIMLPIYVYSGNIISNRSRTCNWFRVIPPQCQSEAILLTGHRPLCCPLRFMIIHMCSVNRLYTRLSASDPCGVELGDKNDNNDGKKFKPPSNICNTACFLLLIFICRRVHQMLTWIGPGGEQIKDTLQTLSRFMYSFPGNNY